MEVSFSSVPENQSLNNKEKVTCTNEETFSENESLILENYIQGVTITEELFEKIPDESNAENNVIKEAFENIPDQSNAENDDIAPFSEKNSQCPKSPGIDQQKQNNNFDHSQFGQNSQVDERKTLKKRAGASCHFCGKSFFDGSTLQKHINGVHLKLNPFKCEKCQLHFSQKSTLQRHLNIVHVKALKLSPYQCEKCQLCFSDEIALDKHVLRHHFKMKYPPRKLKCTYCDATFDLKAQLEYHINSVHLNTKKYRCKYCEKSFDQKMLLIRHVERIHLEIKDHKCNQCNKAYYDKCELRKHVEFTHD